MENTDMKKAYISPVAEEIRIQMTGLLATSTLSLDSSEEVTDENEILSREDDLFFFETPSE